MTLRQLDTLDRLHRRAQELEAARYVEGTPVSAGTGADLLALGARTA